ncbi:unnamed protein product [Brachionus calyciflorus]|uniref:Heat shock protein 70 n=1 Tax=Brachionus calyciflorus TaxID=104777 RepID=A0A814G774_9BILA|nr:unnamed protein product [Brachionus calyciflorus]
MAAIGIDLGTTFTCVGYFENDRHEIIENKYTGSRLTPSVVTFTDSGFKIGKPSRVSENSVYEIKRIVGKSFLDENVQKDIGNWSFKVTGDHSKPKIHVSFKNENRIFSLEEISAFILREMKNVASLHLNQNIKQAVITVPAYFNDSQRQATIDAAKIAGLKVLNLLNEPTAAALAYGYDKKLNNQSNVLVYDLGGGTFDVSIMEVDDGYFKIKAIGGDTLLGGTDFDNRLTDHFVKLIKDKHNINLNKKALLRLRNECEKVKRELTQLPEATIEIDALLNGCDFVEKISRSTFEKINADLFKRTMDIIDTTLKSANLTKNDIDDIVLVGGSSRIPKIKQMLLEYFDGKTIKQDINPDEVVAYGAAIQAALLTGTTNLSIKTIKDAIPQSLGAEKSNGQMVFYFNKNTNIPVSKNINWTTIYDNQKSVRFSIYEGEDKIAKNNNFLGEFILSNIKIAPAGSAKINCTFSIDFNGILSVVARDLDTQSSNSIVINSIRDYLINPEELEKTIIDMNDLFA